MTALHQRWNAAALAATALGMLAAAPAPAITFDARSSVSVFPGPSGTLGNSDFGTAPVSSESERDGFKLVPGPLGNGESAANTTARARADMSGLHMVTMATGSLTAIEPFVGATFSASSRASASLSDTFVLHAAGLAAGALMTTTFNFRVQAAMSDEARRDGSVDPAIPGNAEARSSWDAFFAVRIDGIDSTVSASQSCAMTAGGVFNCSGDLPGSFAVSIGVNNGQSVTISMQGEIRSNVLGTVTRGGDAFAIARTDLGHTIAWGGLTDLRDASGMLVSSFTAISATSGHDYTNAFTSAVPEPSASLLMLAGLGFVGYAAHRRKRALIGKV